MKKVKKVLSFLLVFCMILTIMPMGVYATDLEESSAAADDLISEATPTPVPAEDIPADDPVEGEPTPAPTEQPTPKPTEEPASYSITPYSGEASVSCKIVHLDCGRKYFTKEWIIALINEIAADGYTHLELAIGNDGLRFLLDDMAVRSYSSDQVKAGIQAGNKAYHDFDTNELTQAEMDEIFEAANKAGIGIIPLINTPGHMDAIVTAMTQLGISNPNYNSSKTTVDLSNTEAVNFTKALVQKYATYFKSKGCTIFNMGCDEYANDVYPNGSMGFGNLVSTGRYDSFVTYVNDLAAIIKNAGMTPMAFNDGFYFQGNTSYGTFDTDIMISFWTSGWGEYYSESAAQLAKRGHKMINTHGDFYYVLGKNDNLDGNYTYANGFSNTAFPGSTVSNPLGSMFCIWCDYPNAETEQQIAANTRLAMRAMAKRMNNESIVGLDTSVVSGGFNEDGTLNTQEEPTPTPAPTAQPDEPVKYDETIELEIGGTKNKTQENVNNENNVDRTHLDESIATVEVTGTNATEGTTTYTRATGVTCDTLISDDSNNWVAASGYYYTPDGTNYYPVYAKRSSSGFLFWKTYEYTWGYSTTSSASDVIPIGSSQSTDSTNTYPNITVYTKSDTDGTPASTTITFTGVYPGTTYVTVGETTYKIVVNYKKETVNLVINGTETRSQNRPITGDPQITGDTDAVEVLVSGSSITFRGLAVGTATVTVGNTIYTVNVTEEDLTQVTPLTIEYWITNGRPTDDNGATKSSIDVNSAYSETGIDVIEIVPVNTKKESRTLLYWRCRLLDKTLSNSSTSGTEEQTEVSGDDETYSGVAFTKVRYWNGTWAVYTEDNEWVAVTDNHQLVAYYLEILPVADELVVNAADWGKKGDGSTSGDYLDPNSSCTVSVRVVYEDGTTNPATTTAADLCSKTIVYGYWTSGRGIGTLKLNGLDGYQIWKVEAETGSETYDAYSSSTWGSYTVASFTWDNNAMTVFEDAENPVDSYTIHNDAHNPSKDGYYENLMWDENHEAILITVYVKAKPTENTLKVIYYDEKFGDELYSYNINVKSGVDFDSITPTPSNFVGNTERIDVTGCGIENSLGITQKFQTDLTKVPEAVGKYRNDLYAYTGSWISEDKTTLCLYYTINTEALSPMYVVDFGLPIEFPMSAVVSETETVKNVTVKASTRYGTLSYDETSQKFTYAPARTLEGIDVLTINILFDGQDSVTTTNVGVMPATTVYYEEGFATYSEDGWTGGSKGTGTQTASVVGSGAHYGYDDKYAKETKGPSNGTEAVSSAIGDKATFEFTGTGVEIYTNNTPDSGSVMASIYNAETNAHVKTYIVHTAMQSGNSNATQGQNVTAYNVPIISARDLAYGQYKVVIKHVKSSATDAKIASVSLDGFRVHGTLASDTQAYAADLEDNPTFIELRDQVLRAVAITDNGEPSNQYASQIAKNVYSQVYSSAGATAGAVIIDVNSYTDGKNAQDLLDNGPKNELYLRNGQSVVFKVTTNRVVQIGLKALNAPTSYTINNGSPQLLNTSTDMFYKVLDSANNNPEREEVITITNTGEGILSITLVKICDDPNAAFASLTEEDLIPALLSLGFEDKATSTPEPTAEPTIEPTATPEPTAEPTPVVTPTPAPTNPPKPVVPNNPIQDFFNAVRNILNKWFGW